MTQDYSNPKAFVAKLFGIIHEQSNIQVSQYKNIGKGIGNSELQLIAPKRSGIVWKYFGSIDCSIFVWFLGTLFVVPNHLWKRGSVFAVDITVIAQSTQEHWPIHWQPTHK